MSYEDYVNFEQAKILKELEFDWKCNHYYNTQTKEFLPVDWFDYDGSIDANDLYQSNPPKGIITYRISAPTLAQAQKWLREKHNIDICIVRSFTFTESYYYEILIDCDYDNMIQQASKPNITYEEALLESINKSLEILNEK